MLILQYAPVVYKIEQAAQPILLALAKKFESQGSNPIDAISKAFSMHARPPSEWTADEWASFNGVGERAFT